MTQPFTVGQRVLSTLNEKAATITELTEKGFKYRLDTPVIVNRPHYGTWGEGEVFEEGFKYWTELPADWSPRTDARKPGKMFGMVVQMEKCPKCGLPAVPPNEKKGHQFCLKCDWMSPAFYD